MADEPLALSKTFVLEIEDVTVGYFLGCSGVDAEYETYSYGEGGLNTFVHQLPGRLRYRNLVLSRGVTSGQELLKWFQKCKERSSRGAITIKMLRSDLTVEQTWAFAAAWAVKYTGPEVNVESDGMAIERLEIAHEGLVPGVS
jgi:phage tail-like protein